MGWLSTKFDRFVQKLLRQLVTKLEDRIQALETACVEDPAELEKEPDITQLTEELEQFFSTLTEARPCPFCGGSGGELMLAAERSNQFSIACLKCGAAGSIVYPDEPEEKYSPSVLRTIKWAVDAWNRRSDSRGKDE